MNHPHWTSNRCAMDLLLCALFLLALCLRANHADLMEFKHDEAVAWLRAQAMLSGLEFPASGLMSSKGLANFPLFLYIIAFLSLFFRHPDALVYPIAVLNSLAVFPIVYAVWRLANTRAALIAGLLYAVSPCAVFLSRKIWAQDFLPFWSAAMFACVAGLLTADARFPRRRVSFLLGLLAATSFQIHYSALFAISGYVAVAAIWRRHFAFRALALGCATGLIPAIPFFASGAFISQSHLPELSRQPWTGGLLRLKDLILYFVRQPADAGFPGYLGDGYQAFVRSMQFYYAFRYLLSVAVVAGGVACLLRVVRNPGDRKSMAPFLLTIAPLSLFLLCGISLIPSYFAALYPLPFLLASLAICAAADGIGRSVERRAGVAALLLLLAVTVFLHVAYIGRFVDRVSAQGGAEGDYGMAYAERRASASRLLDQGRPLDRLNQIDLADLAALYEVQSNPPKTCPPKSASPKSRAARAEAPLTPLQLEEDRATRGLALSLLRPALRPDGSLLPLRKGLPKRHGCAMKENMRRCEKPTGLACS